MLKSLLRGMRFRSGLSYNLLAILSTIYSASISGNHNPLKIFLIIMFMLFSIRLAFLVNNLYDVKEDKKHPEGVKKNPFIYLNNEEILKAKMIVIVIAICSIAIFHLIFQIFSATLLYAFLLLLDIIYSAPPRLKEKPPFDLFSHSLYFGSLLVFIPLLLYHIRIDLKLASILVGVSLISIAMELGNHISDYEYDKRAGVKTFSTRFGEGFSNIVLKVSYLLGISFLLATIFITLTPLVLILIFLIGLVYSLNSLFLSKTCGIVVNVIMIFYIIISML